jgi:SAM-dependent methyltransferase
MTAAERWANGLAEWAVPLDLLAAVREPPWTLRPEMLASRHGRPHHEDSPTTVRAREVLPPGGSVLDVGAGTGDTSLGLVPPAVDVVAVDTQPQMLEAFAERAEELGADHVQVVGRWPDVAAAAGTADVVVCGHVAYNVPDIAAFLTALDAAARRRVVIELTAVHPHTQFNELWRLLHGIDRPTRPTAHDLLDVLTEGGIKPDVEWWQLPAPPAPHSRAELLASVARRVCIPESRYADLDAVLDGAYAPAPRDVATIWWGSAG